MISDMDKEALFAMTLELQRQSEISLDLARRVLDLEKAVASLMETRYAS